MIRGRMAMTMTASVDIIDCMLGWRAWLVCPFLAQVTGAVADWPPPC